MLKVIKFMRTFCKDKISSNKILLKYVRLIVETVDPTFENPMLGVGV